MHRVRRLSPLFAALIALLLAVSPVAAAGPFTPATSHWLSVAGAVKPAFPAGSTEGLIGSHLGPDGKLYAWGSFINASGHATADFLVYYDTVTKTWKGLGSDGAGNGALNNIVYSVAWLGGKLIAGGNFTNAGGTVGVDHVAVWSGSAWGPVGALGAISGNVYAMSVLNGVLNVGGAFLNAGGEATADYVAVWDGATWSGLNSSGELDGAITGPVWTLQPLSDGRLYIGGDFANDGPSGLCDSVCWWDPASEDWNPVGGSAAPDNAISGAVYALVLMGGRVYIGGTFTNAAGNAKADYIAVWNGTTWTNVGANGANPALTNRVNGLTLYGSNLIVTGAFLNAGGLSAGDGIAVWNGSRWLALASPAPNNAVLRSYLTGRTLYVMGLFTQIGGLANTGAIAAYGLPAAPSAPRSLAGLAGSHRVTLTWLAPSTTNGGGAVSDYIVQYRKYGTTTWKTFADGVRTTRSAVVTGLTSHAKYQFRVVAKNLWGIGTYSTVITRYAG